MNDRRYAMSVAISEMAFWREPRNTWEKIGSVTPGLEMLFGGPSNADTSQQIEEIEVLIDQSVSGLVVFTSDSKAIAPSINRAVGQGIPVVTAFADVPQSQRLAHIGTDQRRLATDIAAQAMKYFQAKKGKAAHSARALILLGGHSSLDQQARYKGIWDKLRSMHPNIQCVCEEDNFDAAIAEAKVIAELERNPELDFVFGCNSQSALGAVKALREQGKEKGDVVVTGWDSERAVLQMIDPNHPNGGWVQATSVLYSSYMVQVCFALLEAAHLGYLYADTLSTQELRLPAVPGRIQIPVKQIVTKDNVWEYLGKE